METTLVSRTDSRPRPRVGCRLICLASLAALLLAGCAGEPSGPPASLGGSADTVFSDEQLMAMLVTVEDGAGNTAAPLQTSSDLRIAFKDGSSLPARPAAKPAECAAFQPESMLAVPDTLKMQFAEGMLPPSDPSATDTTMILLKSAPTSDLAGANFAYTDDQVSACASFTLTYPGSESAQDARLVKTPAIGDKSYATTVTGGLKPGDVTVAMQVLTGTVSIGLGRMVAASDAEATAADLATLAQRIVDKVREGAPTVPTTPPNALTPEQLAELLDGVTGPTGDAIHVAGGMTIRPGAGPPLSPETCVFDQVAYIGSHAGASTADGAIQGEGKLDMITVSVTSLPESASPPYPFDAKVALFQDCTTVQGTLAGGVTRTWELSKLDVKTNGEASYAVAYRVYNPGGSEEWAVMVGARNGSLSVEAETGALSESALQQAAAGLAAVIDQVLANAEL